MLFGAALHFISRPSKHGGTAQTHKRLGSTVAHAFPYSPWQLTPPRPAALQSTKLQGATEATPSHGTHEAADGCSARQEPPCLLQHRKHVTACYVPPPSYPCASEECSCPYACLMDMNIYCSPESAGNRTQGHSLVTPESGESLRSGFNWLRTRD